MALLAFTTRVFAQVNPVQAFFTNLNNEFQGTLGSITDTLEHKLCEQITSEVLSDPWQKAGVEVELMTTCFTLLAEAELAGTGIAIAVALTEAAVTNTIICLAIIAFLFNNPFDQLASQVCENLPALPQQPVSPSPPSGLATIPKITATAGPEACMLCWLNGYFNQTAIDDGICNFSDYYVPAKYLVRYFCDSSVADEPVFETL